jgi:glycosyltransferase involved in cell wall biosynthesis
MSIYFAEKIVASGPKASVVINTYNRAAYLRNAVVSIAAQSYGDVELVIVNGPSTDHTEKVLDEIESDGIRIKRANCPHRNLSKSRNVGISQASGDVVLFIDDDAVAHGEWVSRIMASYSDSRVGAAGGFTFDHTGVNYQCRYTVCDKFGNARFFDTLDPETLVAATVDFFYPSLLGTNCSFSRDLLERIGGFDEVFEYMLDETDVCARIAAKSKRIITVPTAYVFHKYAPSDTRTLEKIPLSLLAPARSKAYFCLKHSKTARADPMNLDVIAEIERYRKDIDFSNKWFLDHKKISPAHYSRLNNELSAGISDGMRLGVSRAMSGTDAGISSGISQSASSPAFLKVQRPRVPGRSLKIYFVSQGYPPADTAGIARWTYECAVELTARGHEVHVITRSHSRSNHVDYLDGVWVHSVIDAFDEELTHTSPVPLPPSIARRATAVLREIIRSEAIWGVDVVSAPIWDVEGILCCAHLKKPVVTSLHTTYKLAMQFKPQWSNDLEYRVKHVNKVIAAETWLMENSRAILANSQQVINEINDNYNGVLSRYAGKITTIWHGLGTPVDQRSNAGPQHDARGGKTTILFVGRLEQRKGPDQILSALAKIPSTLEKLEMIFIGSQASDSDPYRVSLAKQADGLKARNPRLSLKFLGYLSDLELQEHYSHADVFIAPSRFESFGLVLIEAMRHGLPVIGCDVGGMREIISDGVDGFMVRVDDPEQLANRIKMLVENPDVRKQVGDAARQTYESRFTGRKMAESIEKMFSEMTGEFVHGRH